MKPPPIVVVTDCAPDRKLTTGQVADVLLDTPPAVAVDRAWRAGYVAGSWTSFVAGMLAASGLFIVAALLGWAVAR